MYLYQSTISRILLYPALLSLLLSLGYANIIFNLILYVKFNIITYSSIKSFSTYNTNKFNIWSFFDYENTEYVGDCYVLCTVNLSYPHFIMICMTLAKPLNVELYFLYYPNLLQEAEYE